MEKRTASRLLSATMLAVLIALAVHRSEINRGAMGKDAYLAKQSQRFDRFYAHPGRDVPIAAALMFGTFFGVYELLALGIYNLMAFHTGHETN